MTELQNFETPAVGVKTTYTSSNYDDTIRIEFIESHIFDEVIFDKITKNWIIRDRETSTPVSFGKTFRDCVDRLIKKEENRILD